MLGHPYFLDGTVELGSQRFEALCPASGEHRTGAAGDQRARELLAEPRARTRDDDDAPVKSVR